MFMFITSWSMFKKATFREILRSKGSLFKHICSWHDKFIILWTMNRQAKIFYVNSWMFAKFNTTPYFKPQSLVRRTKSDTLSLLGKKSFGKIHEKYQPPLNPLHLFEKTPTSFELSLSSGYNFRSSSLVFPLARERVLVNLWPLPYFWYSYVYLFKQLFPYEYASF